MTDVAANPPNQRERRNAGDVVRLSVPADSAYVAVLRTATAAVAARLDFDLDEIDDLRIAVDEASALVLPDAADSATLECVFRLADDSLDIEVNVMTKRGHLPASSSFAWTVLNALVGDVRVHKDEAVEGGCHVAIHLRKTRSRPS